VVRAWRHNDSDRTVQPMNCAFVNLSQAVVALDALVKFADAYRTRAAIHGLNELVLENSVTIDGTAVYYPKPGG
jgi:hypothetical protein